MIEGLEADETNGHDHYQLNDLKGEQGQNHGPSTGVANTKEHFPVATVLDNVVAMFSQEAKDQNVTLRYRTSHAWVVADPITLMRIISNLVSNAIKHANSGTVLIACRHRSERILIYVVDTGTGMTPAEVERLTQPFEKGNVSSGSGLGLHLVSTMCQENHFSFQIHSIKNRGSCFIVGVEKTLNQLT